MVEVISVAVRGADTVAADAGFVYSWLLKARGRTDFTFRGLCLIANGAFLIAI